jgi:hypothetical protein
LCSSLLRVFYSLCERAKNKKSDPFDKHDKKTSKGIQVISIELSDSVIKATENIRLILGKKLCPRCYKQAKDFNVFVTNVLRIFLRIRKNRFFPVSYVSRPCISIQMGLDT